MKGVMKVRNQTSFADYEYDNRKRKTKREAFLDNMDKLIPWKTWIELVKPHYPAGKRGRPPRGIEVMLRMILLQNWFNLSDEGLEDSINDSYAFRKFMGLNFLEEQVPDATTLLHFRALLNKKGLDKQIFGSVKEMLEESGKIMHGGTIVDATIIDAPSSTKNKEGKRDPEMHQVKKGNQWYFGERMHIGVDAGTGYIHGVEVTAANANERDQVLKLVREDDDVVYGDAGYCGIEKRDDIKNDPHLSKIDWRINTQKPYRKNEWVFGVGTYWYKYMEYQKSRVRSKVEYSFFVIKRMFGYRKVRYRGLTKNQGHAYMLCALANIFMLAQSQSEPAC